MCQGPVALHCWSRRVEEESSASAISIHLECVEDRHLPLVKYSPRNHTGSLKRGEGQAVIKAQSANLVIFDMR